MTWTVVIARLVVSSGGHDTGYHYTGQYIACVLDYTTVRIDVDDLMRYSQGLSVPVEDLLVQWQPRINISLE